MADLTNKLMSPLKWGSMAEGWQAFHLHSSRGSGEWRGNFGQDMLDKNVVLLGTHLGTYGTSCELDGNK